MFRLAFFGSAVAAVSAMEADMTTTKRRKVGKQAPGAKTPSSPISSQVAPSSPTATEVATSGDEAVPTIPQQLLESIPAAQVLKESTAAAVAATPSTSASSTDAVVVEVKGAEEEKAEEPKAEELKVEESKAEEPKPVENNTRGLKRSLSGSIVEFFRCPSRLFLHVKKVPKSEQPQE